MGEIRSLTGLRGIAALIVFLDHTHANLVGRGLSLPVPELLQRLFLSGGRQVDIFFVLSGFILTMIYTEWFAKSVDSTSYFKFLKRRFARIYPLHFFMLLLILGFVLAAKMSGATVVNGFDRFDFSTLPQHFLLVHAWGIFMQGVPVWNPPSWSISIEALAYLLFPAFVWITYRWWKSNPWLLVLIVALIGFGLNFYFPWRIFGAGGVIRGLTEFALGVLIVNLSSTRAAEWLKSTVGSLITIAVILITFALVPDTGFIIAFVTAPLLLSLCGNNVVSRFMGSKVVFFLGEISYSIYLGHFLFSSIAYRIVKIEWMKAGLIQEVLGMMFIAAFVIGLATCTYYFVEQPGRDFLNGYRKKAKPAVMQAT